MRFLRNSRSRRRTVTIAGVLAATMILAACGEDTEDPADEPAEDDVEDVEDDEADDEGEDDADDAAAVGEGENITLGWIPWEDAIAITNLWHAILDENGYEVEQQQLDPGILFDGVASGDLDLYLDAWLPNTHATYMEQYGEDIEDYGAWMDDAPLTWTVPSYVDEVDSIADLPDHADLFDGTIVGIEPGAGLTEISLNEVIPTYGLEDSYELVESSTPAMLSELDAAYENEEPILVTLWRPHPAYGQYDLKDLEDPEGALGEPDSLHSIGRDGFSDDHPEITQALENMQFDHDAFAELQVLVLGEEGQELEGAREWLDANRDYVAEWLEGTDLSV